MAYVAPLKLLFWMVVHAVGEIFIWFPLVVLQMTFPQKAYDFELEGSADIMGILTRASATGSGCLRFGNPPPTHMDSSRPGPKAMRPPQNGGRNRQKPGNPSQLHLHNGRVDVILVDEQAALVPWQTDPTPATNCTRVSSLHAGYKQGMSRSKTCPFTSTV